MSCNDQKNPLQHGGTSQRQRRLPAFDAGYVRADEHGFPDWIVFASRFSQYLNYYSEANLVTNNWESFFNNDIAAVLGSLAIQDIAAYQRQIRERLDFLRDDANETNQQELEATLGSLFSAMLTLSIGLDGYLLRLPREQGIFNTLQAAITQKLQPALKTLLAYYKGGRSSKRSDNTQDATLIIIANKDFPEWHILGRPVRDVPETVNTQSLSPLWLGGAAHLKAFYNSIPQDTSIYGAEASGPVKRIQHAANHNLFVSLLDRFLSTYAGLIQTAEKELTGVLEQWNTHPPHYALFLTFLRLYRLAQDELNQFTRRHLDFYYQEVLRLFPKKALPHQAHLLLEPARQVTSFALPQGTLFRGGKDSQGKDVLYALDKDTVFNQAKVSRLMSVYQSAGLESSRLYAAPVANSADGLGAEIKSPDKAWHPFGYRLYSEGVLKSIAFPTAFLGFAVAAPLLSLSEGDREIQLILNLAPLTSSLPANLKFDTFLSTEKGWLQAENTLSSTTISADLEDAITLKINLDGNAPPITNYNAKVHGGTFSQTLPMLKIYLRQEQDEKYAYRQLIDLQLSSVQLSVFVGVNSATGKATKTGLKQLLLSNELGPIDPARPFQPFGFQPKAGSSLLVGSEEYFKKKTAAFQLKVKWLDLPAADDVDYEATAPQEGALAPEVSVSLLARGSWQVVLPQTPLWTQMQQFYYFNGKLNTYQINAFYAEKTLPDTPLSPLAKNAGGAFLNYGDPYGPYTVQQNNGFLKLSLNNGFGYEAYQKAYTEYLIKLADDASAVSPGAPPYVPKLESISLHYSATESIPVGAAEDTHLEAPPIHFYHLYPFGEAPQEDLLTGANPALLLPQLTTGNAGSDSGEFYIGLTHLEAGSAVNLLIGVQEGTADPLILKPEDHVRWSYLSDNQWQEFDTRAISDGTAQLIQTGIISFAIPDDASTDNTLLPAGYLWLRAAVQTATAAVCKLVSVDAQAATVTFVANGNAADFLNQPLPAGSISKLHTSLPAIKKVMQPYPSFGGRPAEISDAYYTRVSERLRHKDRAITIWDYERMILEAFPQLHHVKCLSHTAYEQLPDGIRRLNEVAPGHVTLITIPRLELSQMVNPLRPYSSESLLAQIAAYIKKHISCHVEPHVVHPIFEEVALDLKVRFLPGYDDVTFYLTRLQEDITAYLTPWAFQKDAEVAFGGSVKKSVLINFIEERHYVDYITDVKLYHRTEAAPNASQDSDVVNASSGITILVSVPPAKHKIVAISPPPATVQNSVCIDPAQITGSQKV